MGVWPLIAALAVVIVLALGLLAVEIEHLFERRRYEREPEGVDELVAKSSRTYGNVERR